MGKYYSSAANSDAFADNNRFTVANLDIFSNCFGCSDRITVRDFRISDVEPDSAQVKYV